MARIKYYDASTESWQYADEFGTAGVTPYGIGAIPAPDTAEVGQTVVVKSVDENGKPTEWEVADMASGGGIKSRLIKSVTLESDSAVIDIDEDSDGTPFSCKRVVIEHIPATLNPASGQYAIHCSLTINGGGISVIGTAGTSYYTTSNNGAKTVIIDILSGEVYVSKHTNAIAGAMSACQKVINYQLLYEYLISQNSITSIRLSSNMTTLPFCKGDIIKVYGQ